MPSFTSKKHLSRTTRPPPPPLDAARLNTLALSYVARFATSAGKLEAYLLRKWQGSVRAGAGRDADAQDGDDPALDAGAMRREIGELVARLVAAGYVDDQAFAASRSGGLQRRGYGRRHIAQTLGQAGIASDVVAAALPGKWAARAAALALASKRRLGPFGPGPVERAGREKQIAMLLRAGHPLDSARVLVDARSIAAAQAWARPDDEED